MSDEIQILRQKLRSLCPDYEDSILKMSKQDLEDLLQLAPVQNETKKEMTIREKIIQICPQIQQQFKLDEISQQELKLIYEDVMTQKAQANAAPPKQEVETAVKKEQRKKKTFNSNGVVYPTQMKKTLIQKLPEYRNLIINMPESEMQRMYNKMLNKHEDTVYNPKNSRKVQYEIPVSSKPQPEKASYMNFYSATEDHIARKFRTLNAQLNKTQQNKYRQADMISIDDNDQGLATQFHNEEIRRRGRPRKIKQDAGFNYDNAPNYGFESPQNAYNNSYQPSSYMNKSNNINITDSPINYSQNNKNPYDEPLPTQKMPKQRQISLINENKTDEKVQLSQKQQAKLMKQKYKCKITFYLSQSDLQEAQKSQTQQKQVKEEKPESKQNEQERKQSENQVKVVKKQKSSTNALAKIIQALHESFKNKAWKIQ